MTALAALDPSFDPPVAPPHHPQIPHTWRAALAAANAAPRCGARCRTRGHAPCRNPAMANGRCRMHGGASTGPRTPDGRARCARARYVHGGRSAYWVAQRKLAMRIRRETRRLKALADLKILSREAAAKGIVSGLDWDDLPWRPIEHLRAQHARLAARMLPDPPTLPPK